MSRSLSELRTRISERTAVIGWIGVGLMGGPMCRHLRTAGFEVQAYVRRPEVAARVREWGVRTVPDPAQAAAGADVIISIVAMPTDVREVMLGAKSVLSALQPGAIAIDMSTSDPDLAEEISAAAQARGGYALDAPVSGGDIGAQQATLSIMVGGDPEAFAAVSELFSLLGKTVIRQGGPGAGQHTKLANQVLVCGAMIAACEALLYAARAGLDPMRVLQSISKGAGGSAALTNLGPKMILGDYQPGFLVAHFVKDLRLVLTQCRQRNLRLPGVELAEQLYAQIESAGAGQLGTQVLVRSLAAVSDLNWPPQPQEVAS